MENMNHDMTRDPELLSKTGTGPIRRLRPIYLNTLPPCNDACPAGENIQRWLSLAQAGCYEKAWQSLITNNPMPALHGRVCYHPCENACNRKCADEPVSIHAVERFLGDQALQNGWKPHIEATPSGKKVLIIGAGPSGLSCAWHLRRLGHEVEIREARSKPGGMVRFGIPSYRMPRDVLDQEIQRILDTGVTLKLNERVDDILAAKKEGGFDAVYLATGAHIAKKVAIPGEKNDQVVDAVSYLAAVECGNAPSLGKRVIVYGGGNTAMDAARTARRLGGEEVTIVYRRDREHMPAHEFELEEALEEGVTVRWLRTIHHLDGATVTLEENTIDANGRAKAAGRYETMEADSVVLALGQDVDSAPLVRISGMTLMKDGVVEIDDAMMTSVEGIFAGGDMVPSARTVTIATGHGKKAARCIDGWLRQTPYIKDKNQTVMNYDGLHLWYKTKVPAAQQPMLNPVDRQNFNEIIGDLTAAQAQYEAARCYSCGNCFECDGCYGSCPEGAIEKLGKGKGYWVDYDKCTGCRACFNQCPCHAIEMVE